MAAELQGQRGSYSLQGWQGDSLSYDEHFKMMNSASLFSPSECSLLVGNCLRLSQSHNHKKIFI